jgi:hypothetical protein
VTSFTRSSRRSARAREVHVGGDVEEGEEMPDLLTALPANIRGRSK